MDYIEIKLETSPEASGILMAELGEIGFSTFEEFPEGLKGYIEKNIFNKNEFDFVINKYKDLFPISYDIYEIEKKNWNEEWEKNFQPIEINNACRVRASFHKPNPEFPYEIVINPKMTFGTGHHSTTSLMIEFELEIDVRDKVVADLGCGTGILAILARKLGAKKVVGIEVEDWSVENAKENVIENGISDVEILHGTVSETLMSRSFDVVLANINKSVLLNEMEHYRKILNSNGELILSGFYSEDIEDIEKKAALYKLEKEKFKINNNWAAVLFKKIE